MLTLVVGVSACGDDDGPPSTGTQPTPTEPTPTITGDDPPDTSSSPAAAISPPSRSTCRAITAATTAGPYYVTGTDRVKNGNLNSDHLPGDPIRISGYVYRGAGTDAPLANAVVDVWQADDAGAYHPESNGPASRYTDGELSLRGSVTTNADGFYSFTSIYPGEYEGRARHIHVRATSADGAGDVVSQLIMSKPGDRTPAASDGIARSLPDCHTMRFDEGDGMPTAYFDFHLPGAA